MTTITNELVHTAADLEGLPAGTVIILGPEIPEYASIPLQKDFAGAPGLWLYGTEPINADSIKDESFPVAVVYKPSASQTAQLERDYQTKIDPTFHDLLPSE